MRWLKTPGKARAKTGWRRHARLKSDAGHRPGGARRQSLTHSRERWRHERIWNSGAFTRLLRHHRHQLPEADSQVTRYSITRQFASFQGANATGRRQQCDHSKFRDGPFHAAAPKENHNPALVALPRHARQGCEDTQSSAYTHWGRKCCFLYRAIAGDEGGRRRRRKIIAAANGRINSPSAR